MHLDIDHEYGMYGFESRYMSGAVTRNGGWLHVHNGYTDHGLIWQWWPLQVKPLWGRPDANGVSTMNRFGDAPNG